MYQFIYLSNIGGKYFTISVIRKNEGIVLKNKSHPMWMAFEYNLKNTCYQEAASSEVASTFFVSLAGVSLFLGFRTLRFLVVSAFGVDNIFSL